MSDPTRSYDNGEVIVEWRKELCVHCEVCVIGLPQVFNVNKRPWVDVSTATTEQIVSQVELCPSGALRIKRPEPFWPKCGVCGKAIATEEEAEEMWVGPINAPGGSKGYVHKGGGACLTQKPDRPPS